MSRTSRSLNKLLKYINNPQQIVPIVTISPPIYSGNGCYEIIQFRRYSFWQRYPKIISQFQIPQYKFEDYRFEYIVFKEKMHGSKYTITRYLRSMILRPKLAEQYKFEEAPLESIINSAHIKRWNLVKIANMNDLNLPPFHLIICLKAATINNQKKPKKSQKLGDKLDIELVVDMKNWNQMEESEQLKLFSFCQQFGECVKQYRWDKYSDTTSGFYYQSRIHQLPFDESVEIQIDKLSLGANTTTTSYTQRCLAVQPYIEYNANIMPIADIDIYLALKCEQRRILYMPLAHKCYLKVLNRAISSKLLREYKCWVKSNVSGAHEIACIGENRGRVHRIKSYVHKRYWYKSKKYNDVIAEYKKKKIKLAEENVAGGLRIIPNDAKKPQFLLNLWAILPMMPKPEYFDQIGFVLYQYAGANDDTVSFSGISAHDEWEKFDDLWQLNVGRDSVLTIDGGGGDVNATVGVEMPAGSLFHHDMNSYFQSASKLINRGGKHSLSRRHCILRFGEWRLTILFRRCTEKANQEAMRHLKQCNNNDRRCFCLNPHLMSGNRQSKCMSV